MIKVGDYVKAEPKDLGRKLGYIIEGEVIQVLDFCNIVVVKYKTGRRGKKAYSNYAVSKNDIIGFKKEA